MNSVDRKHIVRAENQKAWVLIIKNPAGGYLIQQRFGDQGRSPKESLQEAKAFRDILFPFIQNKPRRMMFQGRMVTTHWYTKHIRGTKTEAEQLKRVAQIKAQLLKGLHLYLGFSSPDELYKAIKWAHKL